MTLKSQDFLSLSAQVGANPHLTQGAGGNTSIKEEGILWVKASGKWLARSLVEDIFVPINLGEILESLTLAKDSMEDLTKFVANDSTLRPSIETTLHAILPQKVVVHVHSISTISLAVQSEGKEKIEKCLEGLPWVWIPYARPGLPLTKCIRKKIMSDTRVLVLQNHGLVVTADSVKEAKELLSECEHRLNGISRDLNLGDSNKRDDFAIGIGFLSAGEEIIHSLACDQYSFGMLVKGVLYPDQVVFLGDNFCIALNESEALNVLNNYQQRFNKQAPYLIVKDLGVFLSNPVAPGLSEMLQCHALVLSRLSGSESLKSLTKNEIAELLGWDAEKYRQSLNREKSS